LNNDINITKEENKKLISKNNKLNLELTELKNKSKKDIDEITNKIKIIEKEKIENDKKNENVIKEKNKIINDLNSKINELNDKIKNLNDINISIISENNKDFKFNNIYDEEWENIKNKLIEINENAGNDIKKMIEKDNQFNDIKDNYNKKINDVYNQEFQPSKDIIKDIQNQQNECNKLIEHFKKNNNIFTQLNQNYN
jgi:hypothetical protein